MPVFTQSIDSKPTFSNLRKLLYFLSTPKRYFLLDILIPHLDLNDLLVRLFNAINLYPQPRHGHIPLKDISVPGYPIHLPHISVLHDFVLKLSLVKPLPPVGLSLPQIPIERISSRIQLGDSVYDATE